MATEAAPEPPPAVAGAEPAPAATPPAAPPPARVDLNLVDPAVDDNLAAVARQLAAGRQEAEAEGFPLVELRPYREDVEAAYNPDESRDTTRQTITLWLIGLLCAIVSLTFASLLAKELGVVSAQFFDDLRKVLDLLVGPVITLLASAVGFYFGSKQSEAAASAAARSERRAAAQPDQR